MKRRQYGLRALQEMMRNAPPMAAYYQAMAHVDDEKQMRRHKSKGHES